MKVHKQENLNVVVGGLVLEGAVAVAVAVLLRPAPNRNGEEILEHKRLTPAKAG